MAWFKTMSPWCLAQCNIHKLTTIYIRTIHQYTQVYITLVLGLWSADVWYLVVILHYTMFIVCITVYWYTQGSIVLNHATIWDDN